MFCVLQSTQSVAISELSGPLTTNQVMISSVMDSQRSIVVVPGTTSQCVGLVLSIASGIFYVVLVLALNIACNDTFRLLKPGIGLQAWPGHAPLMHTAATCR